MTRLKIGEVVASRCKHGMSFKHYGRVRSIQQPAGQDPLLYCVDFDENCLGDFDPWFKESELRPLNKRERGQ